jgi:hypothetical protein
VEAVEAIRKIVLIEDRINSLTEQVKLLADSYVELDRRLLRMEVKFEVVERFGSTRRKALPAGSRQKRSSKKAD